MNNKNNIKRSVLAILFFTILFYGCEKDYENNITKITYFPEIEMNGDQTVFIPSGETYNDPGALSTENDEEIETVVTSNVNSSTPGQYSINYKATNADGYSKTVSRLVIVYDSNVNTNDISGTYIGNVIRNGSEAYSGNTVTLTKVPGVDGVYAISDWIAGFYAYGRGYGPAYEMPGYVQVNGSNEVVHLSMSNPWGDPFDSVSGTFDPATGIVSYTANWLGIYAFVVDMSKN